MKTHLLNICIAFLFSPLAIFSQTNNVAEQDLTGVWKGALYNDTTQQFLSFEIAVSKEKGKLMGYSYTQFENTDKTEWIVKKIKIKQKGEQLIIEDVEHISNTFNQPPPRGVRWIGIVDFFSDDTSLQLQGNWSTTRTKEFSPATGSVRLQRKSNYKPLTIYKRLKELDLDESLSFVIADQNNQDVAFNTARSAAKKPVEVIKENTSTGTEFRQPQNLLNTAATKTTQDVATQKVNPASTNPAPKPGQQEVTGSKPETTVRVNDVAGDQSQPVVKSIDQVAITDKKTNTSIQQTTVVATEKDQNTVTTLPAPGSKKPSDPGQAKQVLPSTVAVSKEVVGKETELADGKKSTKAGNQSGQAETASALNKVDPESQEIIQTAPLTRMTEQGIAKDASSKADAQKVKTAIKPITMTTSAAANVSKRTISNTQEVFYQADSLILSLYDNGEVDGDTVSVLLNGNIIFARQGLTTKANSKVIYISPDTPDSLMLVMYAENLGTIPPNTGLLVVRDGEAVYDLRFRADLQSNAAIILRRKRR